MKTDQMVGAGQSQGVAGGGDVAVSGQQGAGALVDAPSTSMLNFIALAVKDPTVDVTKLDALLRMQREVAADEAKAQFNRALYAAQQEMPRVKKNGSIELGEDKKGNSRAIPFATWEDVDDVVRPIMHRHGFSVTFSSDNKNEMGITWTATHRHVAGHSEQNSMILPLDTGPGRSPIQAAGSTNSYAKRYLVEDFYNIVREKADDDGHAAGVKFLTAAQVDELTALLRETKTETGRWLQAVPGTRSLEEIEIGAFTVCKNSLLAKRAQIAAKEGPK